MKRKKRPFKQAQELTNLEIDRLLKEMGALTKKLMEPTTMERFDIETGISKSQLYKYRMGSDMRLSTFLKLVYGLGITYEEYFKMLSDRIKGC